MYDPFPISDRHQLNCSMYLRTIVGVTVRQPFLSVGDCSQSDEDLPDKPRRGKKSPPRSFTSIPTANDSTATCLRNRRLGQ